MTRETTKTRRVLYILHMENNEGAMQHYAGSTTGPRFAQRMIEHRKGRDTPRTKRAKEQGFKITYVTKHHLSHIILEKALAYEWTAREYCALCTTTNIGKFTCH